MKLVDVLREHPNITTKGVISEMLKFGVEPSKNQVYRANKRALEIVQGSHAKSYSKLSKYAELVRQNNPETIVKIHYDRPNLLMEPRFLRMFISFKAQKDGFLVGCRPFVSFDGYHLKGMFGGVLLIAVTLDGNNSILSIVYAVVECENKDSWSWFFLYFHEHFGPFGNDIPLTFISDRQKNKYHLKKQDIVAGTHNNFKIQFPGLLLRTYFWQAAKSFDVMGHNEAMERIKDLNIKAWRGAPILTLIDGLRSKVLKKLKDIAEKARKCQLMMANEFIFEVSNLDRIYTVKLQKRTCDCGAFQITGMPRKHATLGIMYRRDNLNNYCDAAFGFEKYKNAYSSMIMPIPHEKNWPPIEEVTPATVEPPIIKRAPSRPRRNRRRCPNEAALHSLTRRSTTLKCSKCLQFGHNKRTCKGGLLLEEEKPSRGTANTGLSGARVWLAQGSVPIVVSSQGSNRSPPSQPTSLNIQVNVEASSSGATKKRGRLVKKNMTTALNNNGKGVQMYHVHQKIKL
ncbi:uncharacterized protein [Coffea arabica]|uniref:SWIM-type domain-containing protein n=1 Tax=Coffea arabica TaxID=13443 RepID=A0A6P6XJC5_COFAR